MKRLEIEWRHLEKDGKTCDRCSDTGDSVREAYRILAEELEPAGWEVRLKETFLTDVEIQESNMILLNGIPIEELLPDTRASENCCASCGDLLGVPVLCRTLQQDGRTYEAIPAYLIWEAARRLIKTNKRQIKENRDGNQNTGTGLSEMRTNGKDSEGSGGGNRR